jgi:ectoine hydroxylase-related dioxygenase (phytanoyl-CoA dioxygenase family)
MVSIQVSAEEVGSGRLAEEHLQAAVSAMRADGFVVLENVIDLEHLDVLREKMLADVALFTAREDAPYNFNTSNVQQDPPPFPPYLFRDVLLNEMVIAVTRELLGPGVKNGYYSGNTALKSTQRQPVHVDTGQLWTGLEVASPAYACVVNVPVVDMSPVNGSTELWPGTHLDPTVSVHDDIKVPEAAVEQRRAVTPPIQPTTARGSVLIRDIRLWHAGRPNQTDEPRPMIAMIHSCRWWRVGKLLAFPKGTEAFFKHPRLKTCARFVDGPIDYVHAPAAYDFEK